MNSSQNESTRTSEAPHRVREFRARPESVNDLDTRTRIHGASLASIFSRPGPLVVEIGCGVGLHPIRYASEFPEKNLVAIERTEEKFARFSGRLDRHPHLHKRLAAVHGDAIHFLDHEFSQNSIDEVWILYPNPEMKKARRRWFQMPFTARLMELLKPKGHLFFATNIESYANEVRERAAHFGLVAIADLRVSREMHPDFKTRTHFEKKYFERGETLHCFEYIKKANS